MPTSPPCHFPGPLVSPLLSHYLFFILLSTLASLPLWYVPLSSVYFPLFNTFLYTPSSPHNITYTGSWFPCVSLLSPESSPQVILMTLPKALSDPGCQLCQAQIIWALYYRRCFPLGLQKPLISLGVSDVCRPALFSRVVIKEDEQDGDRGVYGKNMLTHRVWSGSLETYTKVNCTHK